MKITLFYEHVTVLDYAYLDHQKGVLGDSLIVDVEFIGKIDQEGVVYDFSYAKKKVKEIIDRDCDHRLVVPSGLVQLNEDKVRLNFTYGYNDCAIEYQCPQQGLCVLPAAHVSIETLTQYLEQQVLAEMPETVLAIKLTLRSEQDQNVFFHYTHGLKEHYGNCQRLLHGHRSTLKVWINHQRSLELERKLTQEYFKSNIHFCLWDNVVNKKEIQERMNSEFPEGRVDKIPFVEIQYHSNQGEFWAKLPGSEVYLTSLETTVENLSITMAKLIKREFCPNDLVTVWAFEGIGKGSKTSL